MKRAEKEILEQFAKKQGYHSALNMVETLIEERNEVVETRRMAVGVFFESTSLNKTVDGIFMVDLAVKFVQDDRNGVVVRFRDHSSIR